MQNGPGSGARGGDSCLTGDGSGSQKIIETKEFQSLWEVREPFDPENNELPEEFEELTEKTAKVRDLLSERHDSVADVLGTTFLDVVPDRDDRYSNSPYDIRSMSNAWVYRLVAPSNGYSVMSWEQLEERLEDPKIAEQLRFAPDKTPSERTLRENWWDRVGPNFRDLIRYRAAEIAVKCEEYDVDTAENVRENLVQDFQLEGDGESDPIGELEQEIKDDAYTIQADIIRDVCSYDRDDSEEWDDRLITDAAAHMCRRNEYAQQGIKRMGKDYGLIEEKEDGSEEWDLFKQQTFRRTARNVERKKVSGYDWDNDGEYGAKWLPAHELVDENLVQGDLREAREEAWAIDPLNSEGETATWHLRTEEAIERQIDWLKEEDVIEEDETFNLRIDYTTHDHSRHSSVDSAPPIGLHKQSHLDTGYAWKELQGTIKINGRAFIIATLSYLPVNDQFRSVKYILDRARELVNIDTVLADAEFVDTKILRYIRHCGCHYSFRKGATESVKDRVKDFEGRADWDNDWTVISDGRRKTYDTTLVGLEKDFKSVPDHKKKDSDGDDEPDTTLDDFDDGDDDLDDAQMTLDQMVEESHKDSEKIDYFCIITSKNVDRAGIDPDENPIAHDPEGSAWGIGRLYRDRWGVETAFRDKKSQFAAKTRSRDLGYRRFLWMMQNLLYNGWVMLNTAVADQSPDRDDDEIVVKQNTYLDELDRRVLSGLSLDLEFPDVDYG